MNYALCSIFACIPLFCSCSMPEQMLTQSPQSPQTLQLRHNLIKPTTAETGESAHAYFQLGRFYQGQGRLELASSAYQKAIQISSEYVDAHNSLGIVYAEMEKYPEAILEMKSALKMAPDLAKIFNNLGYIYFLQKNYTEAVLSYEKSLALEPQNLRAINNLATAYHSAGEQSKALQMSALAQKIEGTKTYPPENHVTDQTLNSPSSAFIPKQQDQHAVALQRKLPEASIFAISSDYPRLIEATQSQQNSQPELNLNDIKTFRLEISNGNGITGMAKNVAKYLLSIGLESGKISSITNFKPYQETQTVIRYRPDFQQQAMLLSAHLQKIPKLIPDQALRNGVEIRLILGKDLKPGIAKSKSV